MTESLSNSALTALVMGLVFWLINFLSQLVLEMFKKKNGNGSLQFDQCRFTVTELSQKIKEQTNLLDHINNAVNKVSELSLSVSKNREVIYDVRNKLDNFITLRAEQTHHLMSKLSDLEHDIKEISVDLDETKNLVNQKLK